MALTDESMVMPVAPMHGGNGGFGFGGDFMSILVLFFLFMMMGGWGNGFGGGFGGGDLYPWMNNSQNINNGFRDQMINDNINGIRDGVYGISNQLCNGFASTTAAVTGAQTAIGQQLYTNQISDLERSFAAQTANTAGMNALQAQLAQCCCDNRQATNDLRYTVATEACADRAAVNDALRDVLTATQAQNQRILDQMCQDKIDAKNEKISELQNQLTMAQLAASQNAQTAAILANNEAQTNALEQYLAPIPRPAYMVQNPNCCTSPCGTGCGM